MKIKLTKKEIEILERHSKCRICCPTKEAMKIIGPLLNKALDYKEKIGSKDTPDSMLLWYYGQYKAQQKQKGVLPTRENSFSTRENQFSRVEKSICSICGYSPYSLPRSFHRTAPCIGAHGKEIYCA